jgi:hypothetical protein
MQKSLKMQIQCCYTYSDYNHSNAIPDSSKGLERPSLEKQGRIMKDKPQKGRPKPKTPISSEYSQ